MPGLISAIAKFLDPNEREIKKLQKYVEAVNNLEDKISSLSDEELKNKTPYFKRLLAEGKTLDDILPEAFAVVREVSKRTIGLRHYDVQIIGGTVLHQGRIAEMKTGEGKTLVATMPLYLNALEGKGAHLVTVNDYLAKRDARWMGPIYHFLGLSVGVIQHDLAFIYDPDFIVGDDSLDQLRVVPRREAYYADITYGTNNEFGFDYLRDNMVMSLDDRVQRDRHYAIVDEVDSILIDEARTPLIISGRGKRSSDQYHKFARIAARLIKDEDYEVHEKEHSVVLNKKGYEKVENFLGMKRDPEDEDFSPLHAADEAAREAMFHIEAALKAKELYKRDVEYVIKDGEIVIVDEFTGRLMFGRRYSDGIHQAIEAKENVKVRTEDQTLASITFQNYFRMYKKLSGMTGTAATEEKEFREIYKMDVVVIPTNRPVARVDLPDRVYKSEEIKLKAVVLEIEELNKQGRPVLVGTRSIERSEYLSRMLKRKNIAHNVLNAKHHEKEAQIIAQAGKPGAVTIATNMAGRGVDIILGGAIPTAERERRKVHSVKSHIEKLEKELAELKGSIEAIKETRNKLEAEYDECQKKIHDLKKSDPSLFASEINNLKEQSDKIHEQLQQIRQKIADTEKAIKGHIELLPLKRKELQAAEAELKTAEAEVEKQIKQWEKDQKAVREAGGLAIIGTERHESRRVDNQLRGRSGRQGDPGTTRFYTSLEDELMRLFGSERLPEWLTNWEESESQPLEHKLFTVSIQKAQEKVENYHFDIRKTVLKYDDVMNEQRKVIYSERDRILKGQDIKPEIMKYLENYIEKLIYFYTYEMPMQLLQEVNGNPNVLYIFFKDQFTPLRPEDWDVNGMFNDIKEHVGTLPFDAKPRDLIIPDRRELKDKLRQWATVAYEEKEKKLGSDLMRALERWVLLQNIDEKWMFHLEDLDSLREGIGLRAWGQKDPHIEFIRESLQAFREMQQSIEEDTLSYLYKVQVKSEGIQQRYERSATITREHRGEGTAAARDGGTAGTTVRSGPKIGRNDPCPCGSGKKYKKCCGRNEK